MATDNNDRKMVKELIYGNVTFQIYEKVGLQNDKIYYDFRVGRTFPTAEGQKSGPFLQQRDGLDLIAGATELLKWISEAHRQHRNSLDVDLS